MKVIFTQDVPEMGQKHEVKTVKAGYARNYLIPKKLVKLATSANLNWLKAQEEVSAKKREKAGTETQNLATLIAKENFKIEVKVGEREQLFESINKDKIIAILAKQNFEIKKSQIQLEEPIKKLGKYKIEIKLSPSAKININLEISAIK